MSDELCGNLILTQSVGPPTDFPRGRTGMAPKLTTAMWSVKCEPAVALQLKNGLPSIFVLLAGPRPKKARGSGPVVIDRPDAGEATAGTAAVTAIPVISAPANSRMKRLAGRDGRDLLDRAAGLV